MHTMFNTLLIKANFYNPTIIMKKIFTLFLLLLIYNVQAQPSCTTNSDVAGNTSQPGLYGEYFAGYHNDNPSFFPYAISSTNRIEPTLNYTTTDWGVPMPPASGNTTDQNDFSSRYRGSIYIATTGTYTFYLTSDDGSYMWIDNAALAYPVVYSNALINNGGPHGAITVSGSVSLTAGYHPIQIQYGEGGGGNTLVFEYASASITRQVVSSSVLCTSTPPTTVAPPPACPCNAGVSTDVYYGYFNGVQSYFTTNGTVLVREEERVYSTMSSWGTAFCASIGGCAGGTNPEEFSVRFTGQIYIPATATYTFYLTSDESGFLWLDGNALVANPTATSAVVSSSFTAASAVVNLSVGLHDFRIHYGDRYGNNSCILEYQSAAIPRQVILKPSFCSCLSNVGNGNLPVELLNFSATKASDSKVLLKWETASEANNKQFDVERSSNGTDFVTIGAVPAKGSGTSSKTNHYEWIDADPGSGILYYRLKQMDQNQSSKLYKIVSVEFNTVSPITFQVFPNPSNGTFEISVTGVSENSSPEITIHTIEGREVYYTRIDPLLTENNKATLRVTPGIEKGLYLVNCMVNGRKFPAKLVIE